MPLRWDGEHWDLDGERPRVIAEAAVHDSLNAHLRVLEENKSGLLRRAVSSRPLEACFHSV